MTQAAFDALWMLDEIPACPVGMVLLKAWAEATPYGVEVALGNDVSVLGKVPGSAAAEWDLFIEHYGGCGKCNEASASW